MKIESGTGLVERAKAFAAEAHAWQKYGDAPYTVHTESVAGILIELLARSQPDRLIVQELIAAAYLHDVLEDTEVTREELVVAFGDAVTLLVDAVTDGSGQTRKERKERPYTLIPMVRWSLLIKLADRIANVESAKVTGKEDRLRMYREEHPEFQRRLRGAVRSVGDRMLFDRLDHLLEEP